MFCKILWILEKIKNKIWLFILYKLPIIITTTYNMKGCLRFSAFAKNLADMLFEKYKAHEGRCFILLKARMFFLFPPRNTQYVSIG